MQYINRYSLEKIFILSGSLIITADGQATQLTYRDSIIEESVNELYHPIIALESLRKILESKYESLIGCNGCRIDSSFRPTGGYGTYIIVNGKQTTESVGLFEPTIEIAKLCTVDEHKVAYKKWIESHGLRK